MNNSYLPNLKPLRGMAAILVAALYFHFFLGDIFAFENTGLVDKPYVMFAFFFILSGFIICNVYEEYFEKSIWQFYPESRFKMFLGNMWVWFAIAFCTLLLRQFKLYGTVTLSLFSVLILSSAHESASINKL